MATHPRLCAMTGLRVATYNLYLGADLALLFDATDLDQLAARVHVVRAQLAATRFEERARAVAAILARERVDLVGLQEMSRWTTHAAPTARSRCSSTSCPPCSPRSTPPAAPYDAHAVNPNFAGALPVVGRGRVRAVRRRTSRWCAAAARSRSSPRRTGAVRRAARRGHRHRGRHVPGGAQLGPRRRPGRRGGRCGS